MHSAFEVLCQSWLGPRIGAADWQTQSSPIAWGDGSYILWPCDDGSANVIPTLAQTGLLKFFKILRVLRIILALKSVFTGEHMFLWAVYNGSSFHLGASHSVICIVFPILMHFPCFWSGNNGWKDPASISFTSLWTPPVQWMLSQVTLYCTVFPKHIMPLDTSRPG